MIAILVMMPPNDSATSRFTDELLLWANLIPVVLFSVLCYILWQFTYRISQGHYWIGMTAVFLLLFSNLFHAFGPNHLLLIMPIVRLSLCLWVGYSIWYFYRHPLPLWHMKRGEAVHYTRIERGLSFLHRPTSEIIKQRPVVFKRWFQVGMGILLLVSALCYGFYRTANAIAESDHLLARAKKQATAETKQIVKKAADTLNRKLEYVDARADSSTKERREFRRRQDSLQRILNLTIDPKEKAKLKKLIGQLKTENAQLQRVKTFSVIQPNNTSLKGLGNLKLPEPQYQSPRRFKRKTSYVGEEGWDFDTVYARQ